MKLSLTIEGDPYEDRVELSIYTHARAIWEANTNAQSLIRDMRKYRFSDKESFTWDDLHKILDEFHQALYLPQVEE